MGEQGDDKTDDFNRGLMVDRARGAPTHAVFKNIVFDNKNFDQIRNSSPDDPLRI